MRYSPWLFLCLIVLVPVVVKGNPDPRPPIAPQKSTVLTYHGQQIQDPFYYLRNREDPDVTAYIQAENEYVEAFLRPLRLQRNILYKELKARLPERDESVPERIGDYLYYSREDPGKEYSLHCRRRHDPGAAEEILLDENELATGKTFFALGASKLSPDHHLLAYAVDETGGESFTISVKDVRTGKTQPERIPESTIGIQWANDNHTLFYVVPHPETFRAYRVMRHRLGTPVTSDVVVYEESDPSFVVELQKTKNRRWLMISSISYSSSEVAILPADDPLGSFTVFLPRRPNVSYSLDHHGSRFFLHTNENAPDYKLLMAPETGYATASWQELIPCRPGVRLEEIEMFARNMVIFELHDALRTMRIYDFCTGTFREVGFPEDAYAIQRGRNEEFDTNEYRFTWQTLRHPPHVYDLDMSTGDRRLRKVQKVLGGFCSDNYATERIEATAPDGARVPITLVSRREWPRVGPRPMLLYAYGAYGGINELCFDADLLSLLDRGFIYAVAHIRGSEEMGRAWYEQGKLLHKKNSFTDFIACAEHLIASGYTARDRLAIRGESAGGLLMGAVTTMRPDLFRVVFAHVPFVDAVHTMFDPTIPLVVEEYEEWGDPRQKKVYDYIRSYSPYENIRRTAYPAMLVTSGMNDPRVPFWEPVKFVARMRAMKTDTNPLLLKTHEMAGHFSVSGRFAYLHEVALEYAFLFKIFGMEKHQSPGISHE